ncbi:MAG: PHP domain-containing protein, partial [Flavobacteriia bacterium]|nr:PHP domain-containing protein [Flavobacteriia bacterium]
MLLNTHSYYSLRYGILSPKEWMAFLEDQPWPTMALTDINNTSACMTVLYLMRKHPTKRPAVGVDFRNGIKQCYILLAKNWEGMRQINDHLSWHLHHKVRFPDRPPLQALSQAWIIYPSTTEVPLDQLQNNELVGIPPQEVASIPFRKWKTHLHKLVALPTATFRGKRDHNAHRLLRAIDENTLLSKLPQEEQGSPQDLYLNDEALRHAYAAMPQLLRNAAQILADCRITLPEESELLNLQTYSGSAEK